MGSQTRPNQLPLIDLTKKNLNPDTASWPSTCDAVRRALETYGCFVAVYDQVPLELHHKMFDEVKGLFDIPADIKAQNAAAITADDDERIVRYYGPNPNMPLFECFFLQNTATLEAIRRFADVVWPAGNDVFCETALSFSKLLIELYKLVIKMVFESYGLSKYYGSHIESTIYRSAFLKYRPPQENEINTGSISHTDPGFINILDQNLVKGLEVETMDGNWIAFQPAPNHFVITTGDPIMAWSNGRIRPPYHRVTINDNETKYTVPLTTYMKDTVQTPDELVDEDHPLMFKPFSHRGYLQYWEAAAENNKSPSLEEYCGVV